MNDQPKTKRIKISIHALREEGDYIQVDRLPVGKTISIHALREEGDVLRHRDIFKPL